MRLHWTDLVARADELRALGPWTVDPAGGALSRGMVASAVVLRAESATLEVPLALTPPDALAGPPPDETVRARAARLARAKRAGGALDPLERLLDALPVALPRHVVVLLQAGAASLGCFEGGAPVATKSFKRYVVRGSGKAQPAHLKTKGKSRYGSRLRLQNARRQRDETVARLQRLWDEHGAPEAVFVSAPRALWADLLAARPGPPIDATTRVVRIPYDLPVPTTEVMLDAYARLQTGRLERAGD